MSHGHIQVEYDAMTTLSGLLESRGDDLRALGAGLRGVPALQHLDVCAGQFAVEQLWGRALSLLDESLDLTATRVGQGRTIYLDGDHSVGRGLSGGQREPVTAAGVAGFPARAAA